MDRRARAVGLALTPAILLAGAVLTAGPAVAARGPALTAASCQAQGGTFTRSQGVKTCTIQALEKVYDPQTYSGTVTAPYDVPADVISSKQLSSDGYEGIWTVANYVSTVTVLTQKGSGAITSASTSTVTGQVLTGYNCYGLTRLVADGNYYRTSTATFQQCDALGIYPDIPFDQF